MSHSALSAAYRKLIASARLVAASLLLSWGVSSARSAEFTVEQSDRGVTVKLDGKLFTEYLVKSGVKPIMWPIIGPTGQPITRGYPMSDASAKDEKRDHPHQRSFWFTHGKVNDVDFWMEGKNAGQTVHKKFDKVQGGQRALIVTTNNWTDVKGNKVCEDVRKIACGADDERRWIDFDITITAVGKAVTFGDTKEGTFGVRVAGTMDVDAKKGGKIVNSEGHTDGAAWGKPAPWVDYHGPVGGERVGIAILNHPSSFRYPTHWHVRTYGLFAANPFGLHDFKGTKTADGSHTLQPGESFTLRYRVLLHKGDEKTGKVAEAFAAYAKEKRDRIGANR